MRTRLPDWLPIQGTPNSVETAVARARQAIRQGEDAVYLTGDGALEVAGAVAARTAGHICCARMAGAESLTDALLILGWSLGLTHPGALGSVEAALSNLPAPLVLIDARGTPPDMIETLRNHLDRLVLEARWMVVMDTGSAPTNAIGASLNAQQPSIEAGALPVASHAMGWLLAGIHGASEAAFSSGVPGLNRQAIWPKAANALKASSTHTPATIADALRENYDRQLQVALGGPMPANVLPADFFALRWIATHATQEGDIALATATAARLALAWGMTKTAKEMVEACIPRIPTSKGNCRAILFWAQAQIALDTGERETAQRHFEDATSLLRQERNLGMLATTTRRWAECLLNRGETTIAALHLRNARVLYRQLDDSAGVAATLRGAGDVAIASGETLSAGALLEQAEIAANTPIEKVNLLISLATMAIAQGNHTQANTLLEQAEKSTAGIPLLHANLLRRRADMSLREGDHDQALSQATDARELYARLGEVAARARCTRLIGDIHSAQGALSDAARWYEQAILTQIHAGDRQGLKRTLTHAAALEEVSGNASLARELSRMAGRLPAS